MKIYKIIYKSSIKLLIGKRRIIVIDRGPQVPLGYFKLSSYFAVSFYYGATERVRNICSIWTTLDSNLNHILIPNNGGEIEKSGMEFLT